MDNKKIGNFIKELRKEKNLSQSDLSEILHVTRQAISNWETGKAAPDPDILINLSQLFQVSINAILAGERNITEQEVEAITLGLLDENKQKAIKIKKMIFTFGSIIISLVVLFLSYYFITTYRSLKVYKVGGKSENFYTQNGILIHTTQKTYIKLGTIGAKDENTSIDLITIYYRDSKGKSHTIFQTNKTDLLEIEFNGYEETINRHLNEVIKKSYLKIVYNKNQTETMKLSILEDYTNDIGIKKKGEIEVPKQPTPSPSIEPVVEILPPQEPNDFIETIPQPEPQSSNTSEITPQEEVIPPSEEPEPVQEDIYESIKNLLLEKGNHEGNTYSLMINDDNGIKYIYIDNEMLYVETMQDSVFEIWQYQLEEKNHFIYSKIENYEEVITKEIDINSLDSENQVLYGKVNSIIQEFLTQFA